MLLPGASAAQNWPKRKRVSDANIVCMLTNATYFFLFLKPTCLFSLRASDSAQTMPTATKTFLIDLCVTHVSIICSRDPRTRCERQVLSSRRALRQLQQQSDMPTFRHVPTHLYVHTHLYACTHSFACMYPLICIYVPTHLHVYTHSFICMYPLIYRRHLRHQRRFCDSVKSLTNIFFATNFSALIRRVS